jgi:hypothetical protein
MSAVPNAVATSARRRQQAGVSDAGDDELLPRRGHGASALGVEDEEAVEREARANPRQGELDEVPRGDEEHHGGEGPREAANEGAMTRVSVHVVAAVLEEHPADEGDHAEHHHAQRVQAHGEAEAFGAEQGARRGTAEGHEAGGDDDDGERRHGGETRAEQHAPGAAARLQPGEKAHRGHGGGGEIE